MGRQFAIAEKGPGNLVSWGVDDQGNNVVPGFAAELGDATTFALAGNRYAIKAVKNSLVYLNRDGLPFISPHGTPPSVYHPKALLFASVFNAVLEEDGTVREWGGATPESKYPPRVAATGAIAISGYAFHGMALKSDHTTAVFGDETYISVYGLNPPTGLGYVRAVAAGNNFSLALVSSPPIDFGRGGPGSIGSSRTFTIKNSGNAPLSLFGFGFSGAHPADFRVDTTGTAATVPVGGQTTFRVSFAPNRVGPVSATLRVQSSDLTHGLYNIELIGTGAPAPELAVYTGANTAAANLRVDGGPLAFGSTNTGSSATPQTITIQNVGTGYLTNLSVGVTGLNPADFQTSALATTSLAPGDTTAITINFAPTAGGARAATVTIASDDADESAFRILAGGLGVTPIEAWRQLHFGTTANTGDAADLFDFDRDGLVNLLEFAFGLDPRASDPGQIPQPARNGNTFGYHFATPPGVSGLTYSAEWSTTLEPGSWAAISDTGTGNQHIFEVSTTSRPQLFVRLRVTAP